MKIEIQRRSYTVTSFGPQSIYEFGVLNEVLISQPLAFSFEVSLKPTKILEIGNEHFFIETGDRLHVYNETSGLILVEPNAVNFEGNDEQRMAQLLDAIGASELMDTHGQMTMLHFGMDNPEQYCNDCFTNNGCKWHHCGGDCHWTRGFNCLLH